MRAATQQVHWEQGPALFRFHVLAHVLRSSLHRRDAAGDIGQHGQLAGTAAEVCVEGFHQPVLVLGNSGNATVEPVDANLGADVSRSDKIVALGLQCFHHACSDGIVVISRSLGCIHGCVLAELIADLCGSEPGIIALWITQGKRAV